MWFITNPMDIIASSIRNDPHMGSTVASRSGLTLYTRQWLPSQNPQALVFWFHGYGAHCHRPSDDRLGQQLLERDIALFALDQQGCGCSQGERGLLSDWECLVNDAEIFVEQVRERYPNLPFFIMGESLGGALTLLLGLALQEREVATFKGALLVAPAVENDVEPSPEITQALLQLAKVFPHWYQGMPHLPPDKVYRTQAGMDQSANDVWPNGLAWNRPFRLATASAALALTTSARERIAEIAYPFATVHGTSDYVIPSSASNRLMRESATATSQKTALFLEGAYHDLLNDPAHDNAERFLWAWLEERLETVENPAPSKSKRASS